MLIWNRYTSLCDNIAEDLSTKHSLSETMRRLKNALRKKPVEFDTGNPHLVGTTNGYACNLITGEVRRIAPEDYISTDLILPVEYDPTAKCPEIFKFYDSICSDDCSKMAMLDDDVATLDLEQWQYALLELGLGGNGKGERQKLRKKFFGKYSISSIPLKDLNNDPFATGEIFRKRAVDCGETRRDEGKGVKYDTTLVKRLTGDDEVAAPRKYKSRHSFTPFAKLTIDANTAPRFDDDSRGFTRRFRRINLPYFFTDQVDANDPTHRLIDPQIHTKITSQRELSGYLNVLLERGKEIVKDRRYPSCDHLTKGYEEQVYSIEEFIDQFCEIVNSEPRPWISASDLYSNFKQYATLANASPSNKKAFGRAFGNLTGIHSKIHRPAGTGKPVKAYVGIDFDWVHFSDAISEMKEKLVTNVLPNCNQEKDSSNQCNQCNELSKRYMELKEKFGGNNPAQVSRENSVEKDGYIGHNGNIEANDVDSENGNGYKSGYEMVTDEEGASEPVPVDSEGSPDDSFDAMLDCLAENLLYECEACGERYKWASPHHVVDHPHKPYTMCIKCHDMLILIENRVIEVAKTEKTVDGIAEKIVKEFNAEDHEIYEDYVEWIVEKLVSEGRIEQPMLTCKGCEKLIDGKIMWYWDYDHFYHAMCNECYEIRMDTEKRLSEMPPILSIGNIVSKLHVSPKVAVDARNNIVKSGKWGDPERLIKMIRGPDWYRSPKAGPVSP